MIKEQKKPTLPTHTEVAAKIAERLGETGKVQLAQLKHITWAIGVVQSWAIMLDAIEIDEGEGMLVKDGSRRRTVGGVFFHLVYTKGKPEKGKVLTKYPPRRKKGDKLVQAT